MSSEQIIAQCVDCHHKQQIAEKPEDPRSVKCSECGGSTTQYVSRMLSSEELAKYRSVEAPAPTTQNGRTMKPPVGMPEPKRMEEKNMLAAQPKDGSTVEKVIPTRLEFLKMVASGKSINKVTKELGLNPGAMYFWLNKWGLKGIKPESAQQLLDEMVIDGEAPRGLAAINEAHRKELDVIDAPVSPLEDQSKRKDLDILQLREALEGATVIAHQSGTRIKELEQFNLEDAKEINRLREELATSLGQQNKLQEDVKQLQTSPADTTLTVVAAPRSTRQIRIEASGGQNTIEDELLAILGYVQAMNGREFQLELYLGEVKTG